MFGRIFQIVLYFKLCRGGQYTVATAISYRCPCTWMDIIACKASSSNLNCSFISIAVPPWAVPSDSLWNTVYNQVC